MNDQVLEVPLPSHIVLQIASLLIAMVLGSWEFPSSKGWLWLGWLGVHSSLVGTTGSVPNPRIQLCKMQQAKTSLTCVLYGWKGLLSNIRNLFFSAPKALSIVTLSDDYLRLKSSLALVGWFLFSYYRGGESHYGMHNQHLLGRIYLQLDIYCECVCHC